MINSTQVFLAADLVQAEAVVVAHLCGDQHLIDILADPTKSLHIETAAMMYGVKSEDIVKGSFEYKAGKVARHSGNYLAGPNVVADLLEIPLGEAKDLHKMFYMMNPFLSSWHERVKTELGRTMTLVTPLGRKRRFLQRWGDQLFRSAVAYSPQSVVGQILNEGLVKFYTKFGKDVKIVWQLHDEFAIQCPKNEVPKWKNAMRNCLKRTVHYGKEHTALREGSFVIDVDFKMGETWGTMEDC